MLPGSVFPESVLPGSVFPILTWSAVSEVQLACEIDVVGQDGIPEDKHSPCEGVVVKTSNGGE